MNQNNDGKGGLFDGANHQKAFAAYIYPLRLGGGLFHNHPFQLRHL